MSAIKICLIFLIFEVFVPDLTMAAPESERIRACVQHSMSSCTQEKVLEKIECLEVKKAALLGCRDLLQSRLDAKRAELLNAIKVKGGSEGEPLRSNFVDRAGALAAFSRINDHYKPLFLDLSNEYTNLMVLYVSDYKGKEGDLENSLQEAKEFMEATEVSKLVGASSRLKAIVESELHLARQYELASDLFSDKAALLSRQYQVAFAAVSPFLVDGESEGLIAAFKDIGTSLQQVKAYAAARRARVKGVADSTLASLDLRIAQVIRIAALNETQPTLAIANQLRASAAFMGHVNEITYDAFTKKYLSPIQGIEFYAPKLDAINRFDRLSEQCRHAEPWMGSGCIRVREYEVPAQTFRARNIPRGIRFNLMMLSSQMTITRQMQDAISSDLAAGKLSDAVRTHDLLLVQRDNTP